MADGGCLEVVRFGGDLELAPEHPQDLATHLDSCRDCALYVSQIAATRELLGRKPGRGSVPGRVDDTMSVTEPSEQSDAEALRRALLERAELLDPANAEDLAQRVIVVGLALQRRDGRARGIAELTRVLHALADAQMRMDGRTKPAVDVTAAARARAESLDDLDSDADEAELFYPDLYPGEDLLDGWVERPNEWRGNRLIPGPEQVNETGEVWDLLDRALGELPEPLGDLLALVDVHGGTLADSARVLGLHDRSATAALARARNHVRGRLDQYLRGTGSTSPGDPR